MAVKDEQLMAVQHIYNGKGELLDRLLHSFFKSEIILFSAELLTYAQLQNKANEVTMRRTILQEMNIQKKNILYPRP